MIRKPIIYGLCCKACGKGKASSTMALCPTCERAVMSIFQNEFLTLSAKVELEPQISIEEIVETIEYAEAS